MSDKHISEGSANWRLSSLWRPLSQHSFAQSTSTSVQDDFAAHWSLAIPSRFFGRRSGSSPEESDSIKGTASLLPSVHGSRSGGRYRSDTCLSDESNRCNLVLSSFPSARDGQEEAFSRLVRMKTSSRNSMRKLQTMPSLPSLWQNDDFPARQSSRASSCTRYSKLSIRRTSIPIAELPALPTSPILKPGRPATIEGTTVAASERRLSHPSAVPPKPGHESVQDADPHLVLWNGPRDSGKAVNWSPGRKWLSTVSQAAVVFCVTSASTLTAPASNRVAAEFGYPPELMILGTALFMLGVAIGTIIWSPLNDLYGRQLPLYLGLFSFAIFQIPVAVAQNLPAVFVSRFFTGLAGCAALITTVASNTDLWSSLDRGLSMSVYAGAMTIGPATGGLVGGFISNSQTLGWRWPSWIVLVASVFFGICCWLFHSETSAQVLLRRRAKRLRYMTKDWALHAPADELELCFQLFLDRYIWKPLMMLFKEPMLLLITFNMAFAYGLLYVFIEILPLSYIDDRHWEIETADLPFISIIAGAIIGCLINLAFTLRRHAPIVKKYGRLCPEERLLPYLVGSIALSTGIFAYAWTAVPHITPIPQIAAGVPLGIGFLLIILQGTNYLLDVYTLHTSAAIAINTTVLAAMAAATTGFAQFMFRSMDTHWAGTLLGMVSLVLIPIPVVFFKLGIKIRAMSSFTKKLQSGNDSSRCSPVQGSPEAKV